MRLDKFLSHVGLGSRKEVKVLLKKGKITVNGQAIKQPQINVNEYDDDIRFDDEVLVYRLHDYFIMNKPADVLSATVDAVDATVIDLLQDNDYRDNLFPVGRLDKDTTGLLLITNNGQLAHQLLSPKRHVKKVYRALVKGPLPSDVEEQFQSGLMLDGEQLQPALITVLNNYQEEVDVEVTITEGKYHQVKRMFELVGSKVYQLERIAMGPLTLPSDLERGTYRRLTLEEEQLLLNKN
ncbi:pseudouridine synthase [Atopobacter phocae]|uniref:pseudouridine synthase n=1 Tax=Atopobacter phocae TaxID=136492 RepID=UPI000470F080|nr:pseudouridine synthase [Atopobacter phocae]